MCPAVSHGACSPAPCCLLAGPVPSLSKPVPGAGAGLLFPAGPRLLSGSWARAALAAQGSPPQPQAQDVPAAVATAGAACLGSQGQPTQLPVTQTRWSPWQALQASSLGTTRISGVLEEPAGAQAPFRVSGLCPPVPSSMVIRDLTLRSAASFGSFHLIRLLYDEYMFYLVEHRVAQATGETPIAVMGEVRPWGVAGQVAGAPRAWLWSRLQCDSLGPGLSGPQTHPGFWEIGVEPTHRSRPGVLFCFGAGD